MQPNGSAAPEAGNGVEQTSLSEAESNTEIIRLCDVSDLEYGRQRALAAKKLGLPVLWLDKLVRGKKAEIIAQAAGDDLDSGGQGRAINLPAPDPWPHAVDGAQLLAGLLRAVSRYMVMEPGAAECVALWAVHAHALDAFGITPRLSITSPRPQCGKTT